MVGFDPAIEIPRQYTKLNDPASPSSEVPLFEFTDFSLSLLDPLPEFDSIEDWIMDSDSVDAKRGEKPCLDESGLGKTGFWCAEGRGVDGFDSNGERAGEGGREVEIGGEGEESGGGSVELEIRDRGENGSERGLEGEVIAEEMGRVSLVVEPERLSDSQRGGIDVHSECLNESKSVEAKDKASEAHSRVVAADVGNGNGNGKGEMESDEESSDSSEEESETDSSSSSSSLASSSSSSDEEEDEESKNEEVEEGEINDIVEMMVGGSDEEDEGEPKGPIRSKNETEVLPPVPPVDVTLESQHQTLPVGFILTIMGAKVIVEGSEKHNPLNEGSILWITESRLPLGLVDEIFGPVKNPYYVVRYNSNQEVPSGIREGTSVSFVTEFADHVLNDKNIYRKGYDASGENDEELGDEMEFSDDEKEAEYRRSQKMAKKGSNNKKHGNQEFVERKKFRGKGDFEKKNRPCAPPSMQATVHPPNAPRAHAQPMANQQLLPPNQQTGPSCMGSMVQLPNVPNPLQMQTPSSSFGGVSPSPFAQVQPGGCSSTPHSLLPFNGMWANGMPIAPQPQMPFSNGVPMNSMPYQQQNHQFPGPFSNSLPIRQPFELGQGILPNVGFPFMQPNFSQGPPAWPGPIFHPSQPLTIVEGNHQGVSSNGSIDHSNGRQQSLNDQGKLSDDRQFSIGSNSGRGRGRRPNHRGGHFSRGGGRR